MPAEAPGKRPTQWDGVEQREGGNHRVSMTTADHAAELVWKKLNGKGPDNLDEILAGYQAPIQQAVKDLLNRLKKPFEAQTPLDEAGRAKVAKLFNSPTAGYASYALPMLKDQARIDPDNPPEGSAPFWDSPEAALAELQDNLTTEQLAVIEAGMDNPAIVIEPIMAHSKVFTKDESEKAYDRRFIGRTVFFVSSWVATRLDRQDAEAGITAQTGDKIIGWRIGIVDKGQPKILKTDGDVAEKSLKDRAADFHEKGEGKLGFKSVRDNLILYGMMMADSRDKDPQNPMDNWSIRPGGTWTMETKLDKGAGLVTGGDWDRYDGVANLYEVNASTPNYRARVRLAVMFRKGGLLNS